MSGFDFGSLRDPNAPQPGPRQREEVEVRARELVTRARRKSTLLSALAIVVAVAAVAGIVATRPDKHQVVVTDPSTTTGTVAPAPHSSIDGRFIPPTSVDNGIITMPVTFPDGEGVTVRYQQQMKVAQLGFAGGIGVNWPAENGTLHCCGKQVSITYQTIADVYGDATPVHVYQGANGESVPYFHASQALKTIVAQLDFLAFQFGPWLVQVYDVQKPGDFEDRMTEAQRETWARSLAGTVDSNGYLVLHAAAPLSVGNGFGGGFGTSSGNYVELEGHTACGQPESDTSTRRRFTNAGSSGVAWCAGDLHISATGTKGFVDLAASDLQVTGAITQVSPSTSTTTTTTTTPAVAPTNAASASFVSPKHGWLVEHDGTVVETTDGGLTWRPVGSLGVGVANVKLRFADANRGFSVPTDLADQSITRTTDDGGATWSALSVPFSGRIYDLAISRGTVYAVAFDNGNFRIWSSPADNLSWTEDPIKVAVGGGPDPAVQLVFSNGAGWLIEVDRIVAGGARLDKHGQWLSWTPPCATANGPATLAAWSATDLIASCDEGVWGSPPAPGKAAYTSHGGGTTFQRYDAPAFGSVAAADPNYALLATGYTIRRSIDGGRTWTVVEGLLVHLAPGSTEGQPSDLGFASNSQGFVIFANGQMVMTYDSGATWSAVTRP